MRALFCLILCLCLCAGSAVAAQVDPDGVYCFTTGDFSQEDTLTGVCITALPENATVMLGTRVVRTGDIFTASQLSRLTLLPLHSEENSVAAISYLPVYENKVAPEQSLEVCIFGKKDASPIAENVTLETYKNLPNTGSLRASDPEGKSVVYTVVRQPRRGSVEVNADGSFTYTPKKNKVGTDSFTYTATDPAGNVSAEATVTVKILKPVTTRQYADTIGSDCRFEAEWLRNTGLFTGESVGGESCFRPEQSVSRGDFLTMLVRALDIPMDEQQSAAVPEDVCDWLKPYMGAALRSGLLDGLPEESRDTSAPISGAEAAVMVQNALLLNPAATVTDETVPVWAAEAVAVLAENEIVLPHDSSITRADAAKLLYRVSKLCVTAPGMMLFAG